METYFSSKFLYACQKSHVALPQQIIRLDNWLMWLDFQRMWLVYTAQRLYNAFFSFVIQEKNGPFVLILHTSFPRSDDFVHLNTRDGNGASFSNALCDIPIFPHKLNSQLGWKSSCWGHSEVRSKVQMSRCVCSTLQNGLLNLYPTFSLAALLGMSQWNNTVDVITGYCR